MPVKLLMVLLFALPLRAIEPDPAGYERILIPIYVVERPGASGSLWQTNLTVRNEGELPAQIFQRACSFFCTCAGFLCGNFETQPQQFFIRGGPASGELEGAGNLANVGRFIYVNRPRAHDVSIQLRVRDLSRQEESWGTEVPVVRDRDMRLGATYLLDVPITGDYRQHLRVFGASSPTGTGVVLVRIFSSDEGSLIAERVLTLIQGVTDPNPLASAPMARDDELPILPAYAELPSLRALLPQDSVGSVRLEIQPLTPGLKYWAMVSVTSNTTQQVTLITPQ